MKSNNSIKETKVLIIEDDASYRTLILSILRKEGFDCTMCVNGDQAMKKLGIEKFDLIIIDYLLPGPNAIEIIRYARSNKISTPAIILTNFPSEELNQKVKAINRTQLIAKTQFNPMDLPKIIKEMIVS